MSLRSIPIRRIGTRIALFMGGDRELILMAATMSTVLIFAAQSFVAAFYGIVLWLFSVWICRLMAKSDPHMRHIYLRHIRYQKYYAPRSTPFHVNQESFAKRFL